MKYTGTNDFDHAQRQKTGVLVSNLGTPETASKGSVKTFLREFLSDPRVVEIPRLLWLPLLHGVILNIRPARSGAAYQKIWTDEGSPLLVHTRAQARALQQALATQHGDSVVVDFAMRYGEPSLPTVIQRLLDAGVTRLLVLPLYPQYSCATTGSTFDAIAKDFVRRRWLPDLQFVGSYHDHPGYIDALCASIRRHRERHGDAEKLVFSYHGEPRKYLESGDPYHCQCLKTTRLVAEALALPRDAFISTFQSRFGRAEWLRPYTDATLQELAGQGVRSVQVICPGFSADCLETLEEIAMENRDTFITAGGTDYQYIPCLNAQPEHIAALAEIASAHIAPWAGMVRGGEEAAQRAVALGAEH